MKLRILLLLGAVMMVPCVVQGMDREEAAAAGLTTATKTTTAGSWMGLTEEQFEKVVQVLDYRFDEAIRKYNAVSDEAKTALVSLQEEHERAIEDLKKQYNWSQRNLFFVKGYRDYKNAKSELVDGYEEKKDQLRVSIDISTNDTVVEWGHLVAELKAAWQMKWEEKYTDALAGVNAKLEDVEANVPPSGTQAP